MPDPDKRKMRELKRTLKKRGNKHRRQQLKKLTEKDSSYSNSTDLMKRLKRSREP
jgi:hypothetical protein